MPKPAPESAVASGAAAGSLVDQADPPSGVAGAAASASAGEGLGSAGLDCCSGKPAPPGTIGSVNVHLLLRRIAARSRPALDSGAVSHPALGLPPLDPGAGLPAAAARLKAARRRIGARALEVALDLDPTITAHNDETGIRLLLRDTEVLIDEVADSIATNSVAAIQSWAEQASVIYRRRRVPMDNVIALCEGVREASQAVLGPAERAAADLAIDTAIERFRWQRRIAGDARKRNRILQLIYKGA